MCALVAETAAREAGKGTALVPTQSQVERLHSAHQARVRWTRSALALLAPSLVLLVGFFLMPMVWLMRMSLFARPASNSPGGSRFYDPSSLTFEHYRTLLTDPFYGQLLSTTFWQAVIVTAVVMTLAFGCAYTIHRLTPPIKSAAILAVMLPKMTSLLVLCYGILVLLSNTGLINGPLLTLGIIREPLPMFANLLAVVVAEVVIIAPYPILILTSVFQGVDPALEQSAQGMGARPLVAFMTTTLRLTLPGVLAGTLVTFVWAFGAYIGPVVLGSPRNYTLAVQVFTETFDNNNWPLGAALAMTNVGVMGVVGMVALAGLGVQRWLSGQNTRPKPTAAPAPQAAALRKTSFLPRQVLPPVAKSPIGDIADGIGRYGLYALGLVGVAVLLAPLAVSLLVAFTPEETIGLPTPGTLTLRWFEAFFSDAIWREGVRNSVMIGLMTTCIALITGTTAAYGFERHPVPHANALKLLLVAPLFVPPVVLGMHSLAWHQRLGLWGQPLSIAIAHALLTTPLVWLVMRGSLRQLDPTLEQAALGLGARPLAAFMRVTLPLAGPSLLVAAFLAFIVSINEFVLTQFLVTAHTQTLSTLIWPQLRYSLTPLVAAASSVLLVVTLLALAIAVRVLPLRRVF